MKDRKDQLTPDLFTAPTRGRPLKLNAQKPSVRASAYRARQRNEGLSCLTVYLPADKVSQIRDLARFRGIGVGALILEAIVSFQLPR
jgi:hypothetical protein